MINDVDIVVVTPEVVSERLQSYFSEYDLRDHDLAAISALLVRFLTDIVEGDRKMFIRGIAALVCGKCGRASCLCGYSDE